MPLNEQNRLRLDNIVQQMISNQEPDTNIQFVVDDFKKKYGEYGGQQQQAQQRPKKERFGIFKGIGKGMLSTAFGAGQLIGKAVGKITGQEDITAGKPKSTWMTPQTKQEKFGFEAEQIAEFLAPVPFGKLKAGAGAFGVAKRSLRQLIEFSGKTAVQTGGDIKETTISGAIGAFAPPAERAIIAGVKKIAPVIGNVMASVLAQFIGKRPEHIKTAFQNPVEVARSMASGVIPIEVRGEAVALLKKYKQSTGKAFEDGMKKLKKLTPSFKPARTLLGMFSGARNKMKEVVESAEEGIPNIFRKFAVSVEKNKLNFNKLNSAIVASSEKKQLQEVFDTIRKQTDFSVNGVQRVAAKINALAKFEKAGQAQASSIIGGIHSIYAKAIREVYPGLADLRKIYGVEKEIIKGIDDILKSSKGEIANPTAVTGAVKKLSNLFNEDNEAYIRAIVRLEQKTGVNLLKKLAASEFANQLPASMGSRIGQLGLLAGGFAFNPWLLVILPLFSPKVVGTAAVTAGKALQVGEKIAPAVSEGIQRIIPPLTR